jgi:energy-coupling factor transport system permease protein
MFSVITMFFSTPLPLIILWGIVLVIVALADCVSEWTRTLSGLKFLIFFIILLNYLLNSFNFALAMVFRLLVLSGAFSLFFLTVHPDDLTQSLIQLHVPFDFAFAMSMATRFVPTLAVEAETIMDAQMSRGLELEKGNIIQKSRNFIPILIPLIVSSIRRALTVAESIESRGFGSTVERTFYYSLEFKIKDYLILIIGVTITIGITFLTITGILYSFAPWLLWAVPF